MKKITALLIVLCWGYVNAQCPTFNISTPQGTVVGCNPNSVILSVSNTSTLSNVTFTWVSMSTGTTTGFMINGTAPTGSNTYTVLASSPASTCISTQQISLSSNFVAPTVTVGPISRTITCNGPPVTFTAVTSATAGIWGQWVNPGGAPYGALSMSPLVLTANCPGTYTVNFENLSNGCITSQTVAVYASTIIPTMSVVAGLGYELSCSVPCVTLAVTSSSSIAPVSYTWTNFTASTTAYPATGNFSVCVPSQLIASFKDAFGCTVSQTLSIAYTCTEILKEVYRYDKFFVFPNPTTGKIKISGIEKGEVMVLDVFGRIVKNVNFEEAENEMDLSTLPSGIYYLQITQPSGSYKKKIIKQ